MNKTFADSAVFGSNNRISGQVFVDYQKVGSFKKIRDAVKSEKVRQLVKVTSVALCLVGFIGVIGAMQAGTVGLLKGVFLGGILTGIESLVMRF